MRYIRLCKGINDKGSLVDPQDLYKFVTSDIEWFASHFYYTQAQYDTFQKTKSVAGMSDLLTDKLLFDFDNKDNIELAKIDCIALVNRLRYVYNVDKDNIQIFYSGHKGFHVLVDIDKDVTAPELKIICQKIGEGLATLDPVIYNDNRIIRVAGTRHSKTGLYKIPLSLETLEHTNIVMKLARNVYGSGEEFNWGIQTLDTDKILASTNSKKEIVTTETEIDWSNKPKDWKNCKYSLLQGYYPEGKRNEALMVIVSTCNALGYDKDQAYYLAKASLKKREVRTGIEFDKEELWDTVVEPIYSPAWKGGQYTCKQEGWLQNYCQTLGPHKCQEDEDTAMSIGDVSTLFQDYADHYEENILTTGIEALDTNKNCRFLVGTFNGIVGSPGSGKTSLVMNMMSHLSEKGIDSIFFSYDMFHSMVYLRMIQGITGLNGDEIFKIFTTDPERSREIREQLRTRYEHVHFCFKQGQNVDDIVETVEATENKIGRKLKLAVVDYNELILSKYSDPVQAGAEVAQRLRQLSHDKHICVLTLLQPSKLYSNPAEEVDSYKAAKGSSSIAQSVTMMLGINRPGFSPRQPEDDKFMCVSAVKNRNGGLFSVDLRWDGASGQVRSLTYEEKEHLERVRRERDEKLKEQDKHWS